MTKLKTVAIHLPKNRAFQLIINESKFDPAIHTLWGQGDAVQKKETEAPKGQINREQRLSVLDKMHWTKLRELLEEYSLGDYEEKDKAIALILNHEGY